MNATIMAPNAEYQACLDACHKCAQICQECFRLCLEEQDVKSREHCILDLMDCADACSMAGCAISRRSKHLKQICEMGANICDECAKECSKFTDDHNRMCADACRKCADECRKMVSM